MRATVLLIVVTAAVWAFGPGCQGSAEPPAMPNPVAADAVTATQTSPSPSASPASYSGKPVDALLVEWKEGGGELTPLDSALKSAAAPLPLVQAGAMVASPDGSLVTVPDAAGMSLYRVDPWQLVAKAVNVSGPHEQLAWSPEGTKLHGIRYGKRLREIDARTGETGELRELPLRADRFATIPGRETIVLLAYEGTDYASDVSRVFLALVDTATGEVRSEVDLPAMSYGQRKESAGGQEYFAGYWPAFAISPDGRRAYIAHSDSEAVTVVDLDRMTVEKTVSLHAPRSRWARFAASVRGVFVSRAEAKGGLTFRREAMVSADGRWLYVTGSVARPCGFFACEDNEPAGLWVIDTRTMQVVHREEGINHIAASPGGAYVAGSGVSFTDKGPIGRGVKLLRTGTWELAVHFEPESTTSAPTFSRDGSRLVVLTQAGGLGYANTHGGRCEEACYVLRSIDVVSGRVVATREVFGHMAEVVSLGRAGQ